MKKSKILVSCIVAMGLATAVLPNKVLSDEVNNKKDMTNLENDNLKDDTKGVNAKEVAKNEEVKTKSENVVKEGDEIVEFKADDNAIFSEMKDVTDDEIVTGNFKEGDKEIEVKYVKNQVLFRSQKGVSFDEVRNIVKEDNGAVVGYIDNLGQYQVEYPECTEEQLEEKMDKLKGEEILKADTVGLNLALDVEDNVESSKPNDPWSGSVSWNEDNPAGDEWGVEAVKALSAWKYTGKMNPIKVGVVEVKRFFDSEDLKFMKDIYNNTYQYSDKETISYHANHVSGIIGATANNNKGVTGVAPNSKLYGYGKNTAVSNVLDSLNEAITVDNVKVLNYSCGFTNKNGVNDSIISSRTSIARDVADELNTLINGDYKDNKYDFVIAAAAGNARNDEIKVASARYNSYFTIINSDLKDEYPNVKDRVIIVGAVGNSGNDKYFLTGFTQLGQAVDVAAPGLGIYSTLNGNNYGKLNGTSMATPHVAGVASIVWGLDPDLSGKEVKDYIVSTADRDAIYNGSELDSSDYKKNYPVVNASNIISKFVKEGKVKAADGWIKIDGKWYYYLNGVKQTGWKQVDSKWYYMDSNGVMQTGWQEISGKWYYMNESGEMQTGWQQIDGKWYYLDSDGAMKTGWLQLDGKWYYLDSDGAMKTGWLQLDGKWYYLDSSGAMVTGWQTIDGKSYYFDSNGVWVK